MTEKFNVVGGDGGDAVPVPAGGGGAPAGAGDGDTVAPAGGGGGSPTLVTPTERQGGRTWEASSTNPETGMVTTARHTEDGWDVVEKEYSNGVTERVGRKGDETWREWTDADGVPTKEEWSDDDGWRSGWERFPNGNGFASEEFSNGYGASADYDADGNLTKSYYWDADGKGVEMDEFAAAVWGEQHADGFDGLFGEVAAAEAEAAEMLASLQASFSEAFSLPKVPDSVMEQIRNGPVT